MKQTMEHFIDQSKEEMISHILELISYPSFTGDVEQNTKSVKYVLNLAEEMGFRTMATSDMSVGIVEMGEGDECVGILVHVDVVGVGDLEKWTDPPFHGVHRDGFIWGRGSLDDKGAVIISLYAMKALFDLQVPLHKKVWLIIGTSEEDEWTDIATFKKEFPVPDYGFSPDGNFPIINEEKGYVDVTLLFDEPEIKKILDVRAGDSPNTVPSKAEITLEDGTQLTAIGESVHSSKPQKGKNAIILLSKKLQEAGYAFQFVDFILTHLSDEGAIKDTSFTKEEGAISTFSPTIIGLEEGRVKLNINIRHKYGTRVEDISSVFSSMKEKYGYTFEVGDALEPIRVSTELPFLKLMDEVSKEYGVDGGFEMTAGTSYAKSMEQFVSWGPVLPQDPQTAHMEDERLRVSTMVLATKMYARFLQRLLTEDTKKQ